MGMAWMTARVEWRRRWGSLALLALLVTLAGGVTIGAVAGARRADTAFASLRRLDRRAGDPGRRLRQPGGVDRGPDGAPEAFDAAVAVPGVVRGRPHGRRRRGRDGGIRRLLLRHRRAARRARPTRSWSRVGCSIRDEPHEVVVNEAGCQRPSASASVTALELAHRRLGPARRVPRRGRRRLRANRPARRGHRDRHPRGRLRHRPAGRPVPHARPGLRRALRRRGDPLHVHRPVRCRTGSRATRPSLRSAALYEPYGFDVDFEEEGDAPRARRQRHRRRGGGDATARRRRRARRADRRRPRRSPARQPRSAEERSDRQRTRRDAPASRRSPGCWRSSPAIIAGAVGSVLVAVGLSALTPRGLARRGGGRSRAADRRRGPDARDAGGPGDRRRRPRRRDQAIGPAGADRVAAVRRSAGRRRRGRACSGSRWRRARGGADGVRGRWRRRGDGDGRRRRARRVVVRGGSRAPVGRRPAVRRRRRSGVARRTGGRSITSSTSLDRPRASTPSACTGRSTATSTSRGQADRRRANPSALDAVAGWPGPTIVRGRAAAGPDEVALGRNVLDELGVDVGDTVEVEATEQVVPSLTVVGEVVAWGQDEVDDGFEMSMSGLQALTQRHVRRPVSAANRTCSTSSPDSPTTHEAPMLTEAGFVADRAALGDRQPRRGRSVAVVARRLPRHARGRRPCCTPSSPCCVLGAATS